MDCGVGGGVGISNRRRCRVGGLGVRSAVFLGQTRILGTKKKKKRRDDDEEELVDWWRVGEEHGGSVVAPLSLSSHRTLNEGRQLIAFQHFIY